MCYFFAFLQLIAIEMKLSYPIYLVIVLSLDVLYHLKLLKIIIKRITEFVWLPIK